MTGGPATILVVDDHHLNLELVTEVLTAAGYVIRQARSAEEALAWTRKERLDMILMDIGLPGMDGYAAVRALKADPATKAIPTVAITAFAMAGDEKRAFQSGFDGYITKPIHTRSLAQTVARFMGGRGRSA
ncbi:MAG TPA: response regulator [Gemmatimonadales bacterium]